MTVSEYIILIFSIISFSAGVYFLFKMNYSPNLWLSLILFTFSYQMFYSVLFWSRFSEFLLVQLNYTSLLPMTLYGPLFYIYVKSLTKKKLLLIDILHFIPLIIFLISFWNYYALTYQQKIIEFEANNIDSFKITIIPKMPWVLCFVMLTYIIVSYNNILKDLRKDDDLVLWLKAIHLVFGVFVIGYFVYYGLVYFEVITNEMDYFISYIMTVFISMTLYFGYQYQNIFNGKEIQKVIPFVKYQRTGLSKSFSNDIKSNLLDLMDSKKPYLDYELRLNDLADTLNVSRNHMSQVINEHFEASFFEFINSYRIREAIRLLEEEPELSISSVAFESGFNNRVSFYNSFKKVKGMTPTSFRKRLSEFS
ncbi:AraC family transcriptional regulator [Pontimicrobium aquaticum]|uniref:AraC family transcriptional regulator n=1 Tax=Pontimicrobium aquaticum TaxID=2565367 RepID=A0A4U0EYI8_9FLAO|nr:helix-turn-helix domain-containing protein [Pontimicrobium aquaticum]TJY37086.1 AraC family transcriptional regulator [Pontimicrobium aquaticum]